MNNQNTNLFDLNFIILLIVFTFAVFYLVLKILDTRRYLKYGKPSPKVYSKVEECKWKKMFYEKNTGLKKYTCVRPVLIFFLDRKKCSNNCKHRKFDNLPQYERMPLLNIIEQMIAIIASLYSVYNILKIYINFIES